MRGKIFFRWAFFSILAAFFWGYGHPAPPHLTPEKVKTKVKEVLKQHVSNRTFDQELMKRVLSNFIQELDPVKLYFIQKEVSPYLAPSSRLLEEILQSYKKGKFQAFEALYQSMLLAIERRERLEENIAASSAVKEAAEDLDFLHLRFAQNEEQLQKRLTQLRELQLRTAAQIEWQSEEKFLKLLKKRRRMRESAMQREDVRAQKEQMLTYFLKAFAHALDHHTVYFTPTEVRQFMMQIEQRLTGIGAQLTDDLDGLRIVRLLDGGPALLDGRLRVGDRIVAVDEEPIVGMELTAAVEKIRGPKGTTVVVTVLREKEDKKIEKLQCALVRDAIELSDMRLQTEAIPYGHGVFAVLRLSSFYQNEETSSAADLKKEILRLQSAHPLLGIILDLRGNGGGILSQAVETAELFIQKGIVVSIKDCKGSIRHLRNYSGNPLWKGPLLILTDKATASCAEIVAQTLQDYGRAIIVGDQTTWGKGSYQSFTADFGKSAKSAHPEGEFKITRGLYYTVSGKSPQLKGMMVDIEVPGPLTGLKVGEAEEEFAICADAIEPGFSDSLQDISPLYRKKMKKIYNKHRQKKIEKYQKHLPILREHSAKRIKNHVYYQKFLARLHKERRVKDPFLGEEERWDVQLEEACQIMKDFVFLLQKNGELFNSSAFAESPS